MGEHELYVEYLISGRMNYFRLLRNCMILDDWQICDYSKRVGKEDEEIKLDE